MNGEPGEPQEQKEPREILESLWERFPGISKEIIEQYLDPREERNRNFLASPDERTEHEPRWHQWGILTHTNKFEEAYTTEAPALFRDWGIEQDVDAYLSQTIDGIRRADLLRMAIPLHDLGKFASRRIVRDRKTGDFRTYGFSGHEAVSGRIVRGPKMHTLLQTEYGLTDAHIEYLARATELHYEFGKFREAAIKSPHGYTLAYARSEALREEFQKMLADYPGFEAEIGLLFLSDSLAKLDVRIPAETDEDIERQTADIEQSLKGRSLDPRLLGAAKQLPVSRAMMQTYLTTWAESYRKSNEE